MIVGEEWSQESLNKIARNGKFNHILIIVSKNTFAPKEMFLNMNNGRKPYEFIIWYNCHFNFFKSCQTGDWPQWGRCTSEWSHIITTKGKAYKNTCASYMLIPLCIIQKEDGQVLSNVRTRQVIESARKKVFGYPTQHTKKDTAGDWECPQKNYLFWSIDI